MTKEEIQSKLEAAEKQLEEIKNLKAEIESLKNKLKEIQENEIPEFPRIKSEKEYWFINSELKVDWRIATLSYDTDDYNLFHSNKYAQLFADKCRELAMLLHCKWYCDKKLVIDFSDRSAIKWCVEYDHDLNRWTVESQCVHENTTIYFTTAEAARKAADWMNKYAKKNNERTTN